MKYYIDLIIFSVFQTILVKHLADAKKMKIANRVHALTSQ